jgi:acyl carrier protein
MNDGIKLRIRQVMANVLGVRLDTIGDATTPDTVPAWDSLHHIHLIVALEGEFSVTLDPELAIDMLSLPAIYEGLVGSGLVVPG